MSDKTLGAYERHETPDDMDGGVTAALIEKEAQGTVGALIAELEHHRARAEKAEKERDEALYQRDQWMRGNDSTRDILDEAIEERRRIARALDLPENVTADAMATRIEEVEREAQTVTDEMVERAQDRGRELLGVVWDHEVVEAMLAAALTEPPARPEGAEEIERLIETSPWHLAGSCAAEADWMAERGVRVVGGEQS